VSLQQELFQQCTNLSNQLKALEKDKSEASSKLSTFEKSQKELLQRFKDLKKTLANSVKEVAAKEAAKNATTKKLTEDWKDILAS